ncbi:unnamed protein product, partial [Ectocarpus sp. 12 AP-2014]
VGSEERLGIPAIPEQKRQHCPPWDHVLFRLEIIAPPFSRKAKEFAIFPSVCPALPRISPTKLTAVPICVDRSPRLAKITRSLEEKQTKHTFVLSHVRICVCSRW